MSRLGKKFQRCHRSRDCFIITASRRWRLSGLPMGVTPATFSTSDRDDGWGAGLKSSYNCLAMGYAPRLSANPAILKILMVFAKVIVSTLPIFTCWLEFCTLFPSIRIFPVLMSFWARLRVLVTRAYHSHLSKRCLSGSVTTVFKIRLKRRQSSER